MSLSGFPSTGFAKVVALSIGKSESFVLRFTVTQFENVWLLRTNLRTLNMNMLRIFRTKKTGG